MSAGSASQLLGGDPDKRQAIEEVTLTITVLGRTGTARAQRRYDHSLALSCRPFRRRHRRPILANINHFHISILTLTLQGLALLLHRHLLLLHLLPDLQSERFILFPRLLFPFLCASARTSNCCILLFVGVVALGRRASFSFRLCRFLCVRVCVCAGIFHWRGRCDVRRTRRAEESGETLGLLGPYGKVKIRCAGFEVARWTARMEPGDLVRARCVRLGR